MTEFAMACIQATALTQLRRMTLRCALILSATVRRQPVQLRLDDLVVLVDRGRLNKAQMAGFGQSSRSCTGRGTS